MARPLTHNDAEGTEANVSHGSQQRLRNIRACGCQRYLVGAWRKKRRPKASAHLAMTEVAPGAAKKRQRQEGPVLKTTFSTALLMTGARPQNTQETRLVDEIQPLFPH